MPRKAFRWEVELTREERDVQDLMDLIIAEGFEQAEATRRNAIGFLMTTWQKLAVSSSRALRRILAEPPRATDRGSDPARPLRQRTPQKSWKATSRLPRLPGGRSGAVNQ